jgi:hypothetical protein
MPLMRKSPEEAAAQAELKRQQQEAKAQRQREEAFHRAWNAFCASPAGHARKAFEAGDHVFQYSIDVMNQRAIIVAMVGSTTSARTADPTAVLNSVCREGWELVNGDFVFVMTGQQSRDKFMSSGQNVAVAGTVAGYYLFKRCDANRHAETEEVLRNRIWASIVSPESNAAA